MAVPGGSLRILVSPTAPANKKKALFVPRPPATNARLRDDMQGNFIDGSSQNCTLQGKKSAHRRLRRLIIPCANGHRDGGSSIAARCSTRRGRPRLRSESDSRVLGWAATRGPVLFGFCDTWQDRHQHGTAPSEVGHGYSDPEHAEPRLGSGCSFKRRDHTRSARPENFAPGTMEEARRRRARPDPPALRGDRPSRRRKLRRHRAQEDTTKQERRHDDVQDNGHQDRPTDFSHRPICHKHAFIQRTGLSQVSPTPTAGGCSGGDLSAETRQEARSSCPTPPPAASSAAFLLMAWGVFI